MKSKSEGIKQKQPARRTDMEKITCEHKTKKLLSLKQSEFKHEYCPTCGWHKYRGNEHTKKEWEIKYINE